MNIVQAENSWSEKLSIDNWTYGEKASVPTAKSKYGKVEFTYSNQKERTYTTDVPTKAGTYYVKARVKGTENYTGLEAVKEFTISKAKPDYELPTNLSAKYGQKLEDIVLPEGFSWSDKTLSVGEVGSKTFKAVFTPKDTDNYEVVKNIDITVNVVQAEATENKTESKVNTDDSSNILSWFISLGIAGIAILGLKRKDVNYK